MFLISLISWVDNLIALTVILLGLMPNEYDLSALIPVHSELLGLLLLEPFQFEALDPRNESLQLFEHREVVDNQEDREAQEVEARGAQGQGEAEGALPAVHRLEVHIEADLGPATLLRHRLGVDGSKVREMLAATERDSQIRLIAFLACQARY